MDRHVARFVEMIIIPSQPVIAPVPILGVFNEESFYCLWLDPTEARTHDLSRLRRARYNHYTTEVVAIILNTQLVRIQFTTNIDYSRI